MPTQPSVKPAARRARLLGSAAFFVGLWPFVPAVAQNYDCITPQEGGSSCTVPSGADTTGVSVVDTGTYWNDYPYNLTNNADITTSTADRSDILHLELDGSSGKNDGDTSDATAYSGGALKLTNNGDITLQGGGGAWGQVNGIFVQANGGAGARPGNNGDDGGRGGDSGTINLTNYGTITIDASAGSSRPTVTGIHAGASAGAGGDMNSGAGDQKGGNSGDAKTVTVVNNGEIHIGAEGSAFTGDGGAHAIYAYGDGSNGGSENGEGGAGATVSVTNNAAISLYWNGDSTPQGVHGIYARSKGGNGIVSGDNSDPGGKGESGRPITLTTNGGDITIVSSLSNGGAPEGASAGMYAISQGGDGGAGPDNDHDGGAGGGASINASDESEGTTTINVLGGATVSSSGAGIMGVAARSLGGNGGDGADGTSGGAGGYGGGIQINVENGATITTDGDEGYAVLGQSVGGIGGGNASTAGAGGGGGTVDVYATSGTTITTQGDYAAGVTLHSIGGGGGVGGDFTDVLAGDGGNGGNGGDAGVVEITSGADVTTHGQYAHGLLVQSIGGSGGAGGVGAGLIIALGGQGGEGGGGENVIVNNTGAVTTSGYGANGIVAQTLSGGGGAAGAAGGAISVGGNAGAGANNSATAYVTNNNDVTTKGDAAVGIIVQSIGGGGGTGAGAAGIASIGGSGSAGGSAGVARIFHVGGIVSTAGEFSHGLVAQSIGGGGGSGGNVVDLSVGIGLGVGGTGSSGGYGGHACVSNTYDGCDYTDSGNHVDGNPSDDGSKAPAPSQSGSTIITSGDFSVGAIAQSIGGGGGNGGTAIGGGALDFVTMQIGGSAGAGSDGRPALMTFDNLTLTTKGSNAQGLLTQSIGGGGGNGGSANSVDVEDILPVQVGGTGGSGGAGVEATTELSGGRLTTTGAHSSAVVTQSIGGGGGNGGSAAGFNTSAGLGINTSVGASGGSGGSGGTVSVNITSTGISTGIDENGNAIDGVTDSHGVVAQSIGGGGGNGGTSVADAMTVAVPGSEVDLPPFAASITTSVGGKGGVAGAGGAVAATLTGSTHVQTGGDGSIGVLAQSIAHGGGNGGSASSLSGTIGDLDTVSSDISTAVGNKGGAGGDTGDASVALNDTASVYTAGDHSNAVVVQSIGGGGGNGGVGSASDDQIGGGFNLSADIGLGGQGGTGGTPGSATVHLQDGTSIITDGSGSRGVLAQSIGGGGGTGQGGTIGLSGSASVAGGGEGEEVADDDGGDDEDPISGSVNVNIGSETGDGMTGGTVSVTANGSITTTGGDADGILAQSIGGSGGLAGSVGNDAGSDEDGFGGGDEDTKYTLTASLGGRGGTGGTGGEVDVIIDKGHVTTTGDWADGVVAQSIGGGGGAGGTSTAAGSDATASISLAIGGHGGAGGDGGAVNATFGDPDGNYVVSTSGFAAHGVLLQSIGGGGGQGGDGSDSASGQISVGGGLGGSGGSSGGGGGVSITRGSYLLASTEGDDAYAVVAQSIGGGGGIGGAGSSTASEDDDSHSLVVAVGGSGGSTGDGGAVTLDFETQINTSGDRAFGVLAQSIGGGGGIGGAGSSDSIASVTIGGGGTSSGKGRTVNLDLTGSIRTLGKGAHGIVAQSIGGGGGIAGDAAGGPLLLFGYLDSGDEHTADDSGAVTVNFDGTIETDGNRAFGILAQSVGGGGGIMGKSGSVSVGNTAASTSGSSDNVTVTQSGMLTTSGVGSVGIFAQSQSTELLGTVNVTVNGAVTGGTGIGGVGVYVVDGVDNVLTINSDGSVTSGGNDAYAINYWSNLSQDANVLTVNNSGTITGNVSLENGDSDHAGTVNNLNGGTWNTGDVAGADLVNAGTVELMGTGAAPLGASARVAAAAPALGTTTVTGDFTQTATGVLKADVDFANGSSERLAVAGNVALDGGVEIGTLSIVRDIELAVVTTGGTLSGSIDAIDSPAVDFSARALDKEIRVKAIASRFANAFDGVSDNQREAGRHLDAIFDTGSGRYAELLGGINMLSSEEDGGASYAAALSSLSPGGSQAAAAAQATLAAGRLDGALRCPTYSGEATSRSEESCLWAEAGGADIQQDGLPGYDGTVWGLGTGGQVAFGDNWFAGGAIGYEDSRFDSTNGLTSADGGTGYLAAALGRRFGDLTLSAAMAGSYGSFDTTRSLFLPGFSGTAEGNTDVTTLSARLRAAYTMGTERAYLRPSVDLDVVYTHASGYTESGAGIYSLDVSSQEQTAFIATPAVEIGGSTPLKDGWHMGGFASAGVSFSSEDAWETDATLAATPDGAGTFRTTLPIADMVAKLRAGVSFVNESNDLEIKLEYDGAFGDDYSSHGGLLRLSKRF